MTIITSNVLTDNDENMYQYSMIEALCDINVHPHVLTQFEGVTKFYLREVGSFAHVPSACLQGSRNRSLGLLKLI